MCPKAVPTSLPVTARRRSLDTLYACLLELARITIYLDAGMSDKEDSKQSKGGHARAQALSHEERRDIAREAALVRWSTDLPRATHDGDVRIGTKSMTAAVLPNGKRLLSQGSFLQALGRSRTPKAGTGALVAEGLPFFLQADTLRPFVSEELRQATTPIHFRMPNGKRAVGYDALLLPQVCEVYLNFRDACEERGEAVPRQYRHIVRACDTLMRGLAQVGIIALVDEATGYQEVRDREALQAILDQYLAKTFASWAKRFPDEFYQQIFRLRGWQWRGMSVNRPSAVAHYTKDVVYQRLAPGILAELEAKNPKDEKGRRRARHHQWLTEDVGHPALAQHLHAVIGLMRASDDWKQFQRLLQRSFPKLGSTLSLPNM